MLQFFRDEGIWAVLGVYIERYARETWLDHWLWDVDLDQYRYGYITSEEGLI